MRKPYRVAKRIAKPKKFEPSGVVFDPRSETLILVDDEGQLAELDIDGKVLRREKLGKKLDLEGVTLAGDTIWVADESKDRLIAVDRESWELLEELDLPRKHQGGRAFDGKGNGVEAVCWLPHRGTFLTANQGDKKETAFLLEIEKRDGELKGLQLYDPGIRDLAGLTWDCARNQVVAVSDKRSTAIVFDAELREIDRFAIPGKGVEGLCFVGERLILCQDGGDLLVLELR